MTPPRSVRTWSAGSRAVGSSSGTTRTASTPPTWTVSTCRVSRRSASPTTSTASRTGCCTTSRRASSSSTARVRCRRASGTGCSIWSLPTGSSRPTAPPSSRRTSVLRPRASTRSFRRTRSSSTPTKRVQSLKALLNPEDDATKLRAKMTAVVLGQREHSLLEITRTLLTENAKGHHAKYDALVDYGLDDFYWRGVACIYGYESASPSIDDLVLWIFRKAIDGFKSDRPGGLQNIQLDFASLRNDRRSQEALATLAKRAARDLDYASKIEDASFRDLVSVDLFEETDQKIISDLARAVAEQTVTSREVAEVVRARQSSVWIDGYRQLYTAIASASELLGELASLDLAVQSFDDGLERYRREWFRIDQLYRQFVYAARTAEYPNPLEALREQVEKRYTNKFVYELGNAWQQQVDEVDKWRSSVLRSQTSFYAGYVEPLVRDGDKKAVVIISDALRYEVADELGSRIRQEDRFDATLEAVLGVLPSYTQLGMAALLPHSTLKHSADAKTVLADDQPTNGTAFRGKILAERRRRGDPGRGLQGPERRRAARALQGQSSPVRLPQPDRRHRRQARHRAAGLRSRRGHAARHRRPREEAGQRQRHQHLHHGRPRLPIPGRSPGRHVLPLDPAAGRRHQGHQPALRPRARSEGRQRLHDLQLRPARTRQATSRCRSPSRSTGSAWPAVAHDSSTAARRSRRSSSRCSPSTRSARATPGWSTSRSGRSPTRSPPGRSSSACSSPSR